MCCCFRRILSAFELNNLCSQIICYYPRGQTDDDDNNEAGCMFCLQDNLSSGVAGVTEGDYRMDGKMELITATTDGESK